MLKIRLFHSILTAVAIAGIFSGCKSKETPKPPVVTVQTPTKEDVHIYGEYVGSIRASQFVELHARVEGYLEKMLFEEGKFVKKGEPLFIINQAQYKAHVEKAKAQLKRDEALAAKASRDVKRLRPLYEQHAASQLDLDNAIAALENAEANIAMSKADLEQAELELSYTVITSPMSGYISERYVDIGTLVGPGAKSKLGNRPSQLRWPTTPNIPSKVLSTSQLRLSTLKPEHSAYAPSWPIPTTRCSPGSSRA